jgi:hypothetical protein
VIDRIHAAHRAGDRICIVHRTDHHLARPDSHKRNFVRRISDEGTHRRAVSDQRLDDGLASLAAGTSD